MKSLYIKPETDIVACRLLEVIAESGNGTGWYMGDDPIGGDEPDPNADDDDDNPAKRSSMNYWEY